MGFADALETSRRESPEPGCCRSGREAEKAALLLLQDAHIEGTGGPANEAVKQFEKNHQVDVVSKGDKYEYRLSVNGSDKLLFTTDATDKGLKEAEQKLRALVDGKIAHMKKTFNVSFSTDGEEVAQQWVEKADCSWERGPMVKARAPRLGELYGIEASLYRSQPSHRSNDGRQTIKFYFLKDHYQTDGTAAYFKRQDKNGRPAVLFDPDILDKRPATQADAAAAGVAREFSLEGWVCHELAHHGQHKLNWDTPRIYQQYAEAIGWVSFEDPKTHETDWLLKGKNDREYYRYGSDNCKDRSVWYRCNSSGQPLDKNGKVVAKIKVAETFTYTQVQDRASVRPLTWYFPNPKEMFAEGMMLLRMGGELAAKLIEKSPQLYKAVREHDQREIDSLWGKKADGSPKYIRSPGGHLVENTAESRKELEEFEKKHSASCES